MIRISVRYMAQLKQAAGIASEEIELPAPAPARDILLLLGDRHGAPLRNLLLGADAVPQPTLLVFVGDQQVDLSDASSLKDGEVVTLLTPIAGG